MALQVQPLQNPGTISGVGLLPKPQPLAVKKLPAQPSLNVAKPAPQQPLTVQPLQDKPTLQPGVIDATGQKASPYLGTPQEHTVAELGWKVKQKHPDYNDLSDEELGQKMKAKFPDYADFADTPVIENKNPDNSFKHFIGESAKLGAALATNQPIKNDITTGALKSLGSTGTGLLELGGKIGNFIEGKGFQNEVDPNSPIGRANQVFEPTNNTQKAGKVAGDIAQFFIPGGQEKAAATFAPKVAELLNLGSKGQKAVSLLTKAGISGVKDFSISEAQGQSNKQSAVIGALGALGPLAEAGIAAIAPKTSGGLINSLIKPLSKEFRFGRDPGLGVATEGITGNTLEGLTKNIVEKKQQIGKSVADGLAQADKIDPKKINISPLFEPIDNAINTAVKNGDQALVSRLLDVKNGLTKEFKLIDGKLVEQGDKNLSLTRVEANKLKQEIGNATKWTGQPFDGDINQVRVRLYQNINDAIDAITPGTKDLNARYSNLLSAEKSAERTKAIGERHDIFGVKDLGLSSIAGLAGYAKGGGIAGLISALSTEALYKLAGSTLIKSQLAKQLAKYIPEIQKATQELSPQIERAITQELSTRGEKQVIQASDLGKTKINPNALVKVNNYQNPEFSSYVPQTNNINVNTRKIAENQLEQKYPGFFKNTQLPKSQKNQATRNLLLKLGND